MNMAAALSFGSARLVIVSAGDALIASTPVYKAGLSGLFKSFIDVLDDDLLVAKPVLLAATAGSSRHALVVDAQMRPLFAYMLTLTLPTSVFAAPEDWGASELGGRIRRAASELAVLVQGRVGQRIADRAWTAYQHQFAGNATRAEQAAADVDFDTPLMRLAAGGSMTPEQTGAEDGAWGHEPRRTAQEPAGSSRGGASHTAPQRRSGAPITAMHNGSGARTVIGDPSQRV